MSDSEIKQSVIDAVRKCVNEYDPKQLLDMGCPADEYEPEIRDIARDYRKNITRHEMWILVCNVLHWHFGNRDEPVLYWRGHFSLSDAIIVEAAKSSDLPLEKGKQ